MTDLYEIKERSTLFPPITIKILGEKFQARKLTRALMAEYYAFLEKTKEAEEQERPAEIDENIAKFIGVVFNVPEDILDECEADELHVIINKFSMTLARRRVDRSAGLLKDFAKEQAESMDEKPEAEDKKKEPTLKPPNKKKPAAKKNTAKE